MALAMVNNNLENLSEKSCGAINTACSQVFHLGVHVPFYLHFWGYIQIFGGYNVPSNSSFRGTKKMNCIFLISHVQFLHMLFFLSIWNKISICCCFESLLAVYTLGFFCQSWHWFTDISYIIVRIGTVIVAVTVMFFLTISFLFLAKKSFKDHCIV